MIEESTLRLISFFLVSFSYFVYFLIDINIRHDSLGHDDFIYKIGHLIDGLMGFFISNLLAFILFAMTGFQELTLPNYITVMGGLFGILFTFYTLYQKEGAGVLLSAWDD